MKLSTPSADGQNLITAYGDDYVAVNGVRYTHSMVVTPTSIAARWPVTEVADLTAELISRIPDARDSIVLLGTGPRQIFPPISLLAELSRHKIALEVMDTQAASRTYNILLGEGRKVAAALILPVSHQ